MKIKSLVAREVLDSRGFPTVEAELSVDHPKHPGESLVGRVPRGAFLLYGDRAWDTEYDWRREASRRPGSVPDIVLRIMSSLAD